jgi:hypothetical protein
MKTKKIIVLIGLTIVVSLFATSCATYQHKVRGAVSSMKRGKCNDAAKKLEKRAHTENDDQLVYLLDYATALQCAGRYKESTQAFLRADKIADIKDYHSLSRVTGSLLLNEGMVQYKGDDYEKVLINAFLAVNFAVEGNLEGAAVEARRLNEKLYKFKYEAKRNYEQNPFARYLSAIIWEAEKNWDSSYIDYKEAYKLNPNFAGLKQDLLVAARRARRRDEFNKWKKEFGIELNKDRMSRKMGELVFIYQQGKGPQKRPNPQFQRVPKLYPRSSRGLFARLIVQDNGEYDTEKIYSVQDVAIKTLDDQYAGLVAKRMAGIAAKAVVADQIRQKNKALGQLAWIGMNLADRADLRQWSTLPQSFQVARVVLKPGKYNVSAVSLDYNRKPAGEEMKPRAIEIRRGKKTFITWRSFN